MRRNLLLAALALIVLTPATQAAVVSFTEDFATSDSDWRNAASTDGNYWVSTGGPNGAGDGYISVNHSLTSGTQAQVIFRGQNNFNSSGNAFVGDWEAGGVYELSFYVRQNSSVPMTVGARVATTANFPAFSMLSDPILVQPNVWTKLTFDVTPTSSTLIPEGATYDDVFPLVGRIQITAERETLATGTQVVFDLDKVSIQAVPEPSTLALAGMGLVGAGLMAVRRQRARRS